MILLFKIEEDIRMGERPLGSAKWKKRVEEDFLCLINYWWREILNCSWTTLTSKLQLILRIETKRIWDIFLHMIKYRYGNFPLQQDLGHLELWNSKCGWNTNEGSSCAFQNRNCCLTYEWISDQWSMKFWISFLFKVVHMGVNDN